MAVVGASGGGKSTLVRLLSRVMDPSTGAVLLDGHDLRAVRTRALRRHVSFVLQETMLLDAPVRANIAYARPGATDAQVRAAAAAADADGFIPRLPNGYDTSVGPRGRSLSGGQRQRVAIARALLHDAPILVLDEPTTGLDEGSAPTMLRSLQTLLRGRTTILVTHDPVAMSIADRVIRLESARVVDDQLMSAGDAVRA